MADFLDESNACSFNLLRIVSRGNAIIAELLRLSEMVPSVFKADSKQEFAKYSEIIFDFAYFKNTDFYESRIESNMQLQEKDDEFRENYIDILTRFYLAFESIHKYGFDLNRYIEDLEDGVYIQQSLESLLLNVDGKQLLCEALYLCGVMLLVVDQKISGSVRERMLVSYYRYSAQRSTSDSNIDDVCNLLRSTGYSPNGKRPPNYPEDYFKRMRMNQVYLSLVIGRLRSDDIYNQIAAYPFPEHRSTAMANQASMLYVCLYFSPDILSNQSANMREIVDKFFPDNWVINVYMGIVVNLIEAWDVYKAAKQALNNTLEMSSVKTQSQRHSSRILKLLPQIQQLLKEGALTEETVLDNVSKLINIIRECNVSLKWIMLHTTPNIENEINTATAKRCKQIKDIVYQEAKLNPSDVFTLLLFTAQLELKVKEIYKKLLSEKQSKWEKFKKESSERVNELAEVFSGSKPLTRIEKNSSLQNWLTELAKQIDSLDYANLAVSSRKTVQIIQAIDEVQELHQLETHIHVKQYFTDTKKFLHCMLKTANVKEDVLITLQIISDLSYAWQIIDSYTVYMQEGIKKDPTLVIKLRATFLKLSSALDMPLLRINQVGSDDLVSVSQYYSSELVSYVRKVLHIIPATMFGLMSRIIDLQTNSIQELPTRLMKDQLKQYAKLDERYEVARLTHAISVFTEGILMMKTTLVGIIKIDSKKLLEDGIRRELVQQVARALHNGLVFNTKNKQSELMSKLEALSQIMDGFRRSFEYIQDYVCIYGLKIWQEEVTRIVSYNVEQECNAFMRQKVLDWESVYQSKTIPIPQFPPLDNNSVNFIGRLARELLRITDPKLTIYVHPTTCWYDNKTHVEVTNIRLFSLLMKSIGTAGVNGLDRLLSFMIVTEIQSINKFIFQNVSRDKSWIDIFISFQSLLESNASNENFSPQLKSFYTVFIAKAKNWNFINDSLLKIGQMQIIRCNIAHELNTSCRFQSRHLAAALETLNEALLAELQINPEKLYTRDDSVLLYELSNYLEWTGFSDPMSKVYISSPSPPFIDIIVHILVVLIMSRLVYVKAIHGLSCKKSVDSCDGVPYICGVLTLLRQHHENHTTKFLFYCSKYINSLMEINAQSSRTNEIPNDAFNLLAFLDDFMRL
ncbi:WASH complex subunit strumpellin-like protein, partial [Dinothrombium tinctorium]